MRPQKRLKKTSATEQTQQVPSSSLPKTLKTSIPKAQLTPAATQNIQPRNKQKPQDQTQENKPQKTDHDQEPQRKKLISTSKKQQQPKGQSREELPRKSRLRRKERRESSRSSSSKSNKVRRMVVTLEINSLNSFQMRGYNKIYYLNLNTATSKAQPPKVVFQTIRKRKEEEPEQQNPNLPPGQPPCEPQHHDEIEVLQHRDLFRQESERDLNEREVSLQEFQDSQNVLFGELGEEATEWS